MVFGIFYSRNLFFAKLGERKNRNTEKLQKKYGPAKEVVRIGRDGKKNNKKILIQQKGKKPKNLAARISWDTGHQNLSTPEGSTKRSAGDNLTGISDLFGGFANDSGVSGRALAGDSTRHAVRV